MNTNLLIYRALQEGSFLVFFIVFWGGFVMSLGVCSILRIPVVFGYMGGITQNKRETIKTTIGFVSGLILAYCLVGLLLGVFSFVLKFFFSWQIYAYYFLGFICILASLHLTGLIHLHLPHKEDTLSNLSQKLTQFGTLGAFIFGTIFVFLEGLISPCCGPLLYVLAGYTFLKGKIIYGFLIFFTYALGQALPLLLIGMFFSVMHTITKLQLYWEYIEVSCGLILLLVGIYLLIIA